jgi:hypothetical protein
MYPGLYYYFSVDGSHTKRGAGYLISTTVDAVINDTLIGTLLDPRIVTVGLPYPSVVKQTDPINYYFAAVKKGTQYWVNGYDFDMIPTISIFNSLNFTSPVTSPFVAGYYAVTFLVNEIFTGPDDNFTLEVVADEGTQENPIELYPNEDQMFSAGRANFCMVGGLGDFTGSSYYKFPVTIPTPSYINNYKVATQNSLTGSDVDLYVFSDPNFETEIGSSTSTGTANESCYTNNGIPLDYGYIYVRVDDITGNGESFILDVNYNGF